MFNAFLDGSKPAIESAAITNATGLGGLVRQSLLPLGNADDISTLMRPKGEAGVAFRDVSLMMVLKPAVLPLAVWVMADPIMGLDRLTVGLAILIEAMPSGANPFILAQRYKRLVAARRQQCRSPPLWRGSVRRPLSRGLRNEASALASRAGLV